MSSEKSESGSSPKSPSEWLLINYSKSGELVESMVDSPYSRCPEYREASTARKEDVQCSYVPKYRENPITAAKVNTLQMHKGPESWIPSKSLNVQSSPVKTVFSTYFVVNNQFYLRSAPIPIPQSSRRRTARRGSERFSSPDDFFWMRGSSPETQFPMDD